MHFLNFILVGLMSPIALAISLATCQDAVTLAYQKTAELGALLQTHVCAKGCALTPRSYNNLAKEQLMRPYWQNVLENLGKTKDIAKDINVLQGVMDSIMVVVKEKCGPKTGPADLCKDAETLNKCAEQVRSNVMSIFGKHTAELLRIFESCDKFAKAIGMKENWDIVPSYLDRYAKVCPRPKRA
ncbi:hypothetical protein FQN57_001516 [Myotisia sp. PD_48]|nr:hypothetical protein FQN57_001516 [Myotisia sp. PD_48]